MDARELKGEVWKLSGMDELMTSVHARSDCATDTCVLHNPTDNHMREWPLIWRDDRLIFERICEHGIGHPDLDQRKYWKETFGDENSMGVHGCDGCCVGSEFGKCPDCGTDLVNHNEFCDDCEEDEWGIRSRDCYCSRGHTDNTDIDICDAHALVWKKKLLRTKWDVR